jgi:ubiquinone/menaquinone biosynthesis C-methylase UbiE
MEKLASFFDGKPVHRVLDIGTGSGEFIRLISNVFTNEVQLVGVDPSAEALAVAQAGSYNGKVSFLQMEGENLHFEDESFDVVSMSNAMHHLADPGKTFSEMKRVVKHNGWILIAEIVSDGLNEAQENQKMLHHLKSCVDRKSGIPHRETWTEAEVLDIVRSNEIKPVLTFTYNRMASPVTDADKLAGWESDFVSHLKGLEGFPEYEEKAKLLEIFKQRLAKFGFQQARQVVIVGTKNKDQ